MAEAPAEGITVQPPRRRGVLFWSMIVLIAILAIVGGCVGFIAYPLYRTVREFTSTTPVPVPVYQLKEGEYEALLKRTSAFESAPDSNPPARLELTADDINALIAGNPNLKRFAGRAFVRIENGQFFLDLHQPLDEVPIISFLFKGRYFNGTLLLKLSLETGQVKGVPENIFINNQPVPEKDLASLRQENVLERLAADEHLPFFKKARTLEVKDGRLLLER